MRNITELTQHLAQMAADLRNGMIDVKTASEINNTAGKIINAQKTQLVYETLKADNESLSIAFLEGKDVSPVEDLKPSPKKLTQGK